MNHVLRRENEVVIAPPPSATRTRLSPMPRHRGVSLPNQSGQTSEVGRVLGLFGLRQYSSKQTLSVRHPVRKDRGWLHFTGHARLFESSLHRSDYATSNHDAATFAETVAAIQHLGLSAPDAPIVLKVVAHLEQSDTRQQCPKRAVSLSRNKPGLQENLIVQWNMPAANGSSTSLRTHSFAASGTGIP